MSPNVYLLLIFSYCCLHVIAPPGFCQAGTKPRNASSHDLPRRRTSPRRPLPASGYIEPASHKPTVSRTPPRSVPANAGRSRQKASGSVRSFHERTPGWERTGIPRGKVGIALGKVPLGRFLGYWGRTLHRLDARECAYIIVASEVRKPAPKPSRRLRKHPHRMAAKEMTSVPRGKGG